MQHVSGSGEKPKSAPGAIKILVVEDDLCLQTAMTRLLRGINKLMEVEWATTADEVESKITADQSYDLVIADIFLPGNTTGLDLWEKFRRRHPTTPFILISGMPTEEFLRILEKGVSFPPSFLPKPFSLNELREAVGKMLRSAQDPDRVPA